MHLNQLSKFNSQKKNIIKKYPKSKRTIEEAIKNLEKDPDQGNQIPGFHAVIVRKARVGLPEYKISPRKGLRLLFLIQPNEESIIPLVIYKKGTLTEKQVLANAKEVLKNLLANS